MKPPTEKVFIQLAEEKCIFIPSNGKRSVKVKISGGKGLTSIKQIELIVSRLMRAEFYYIPICSKDPTFSLKLQNTSNTPVILKEGVTLGIVKEATYGAFAAIYIDEKRQHLVVRTNTMEMEKNGAIAIKFDPTKPAPPISNTLNKRSRGMCTWKSEKWIRRHLRNISHIVQQGSLGT